MGQYNYKIPTWAVNFLINGDISGLEEEDLKAINDFVLVVLAKHGSGHWAIVSEESYFSHYNNVTDLAGNVYDCEYVVMEEDETFVTKTWLPVFPGFYGTYFEGDSLYERETEYILDIVEPKELADCMVRNLYNSNAGIKLWREYVDSISKQCVNVIEGHLKEYGYVEKIEFEELCSPKEYNFDNDSINVKVTFSLDNIAKIKIFLQEHKDEWKEYLKSHYTSCSGFISYHDNYPDSEEWGAEEALTDRHNAGAVLNFICEENGINDETLFYFCEDHVSLDIDLLKKECIEKGWYVPKNICLDWFKSLKPRFTGKYKFRRVVILAMPTQYILETPKQRYIFTIYKNKISSPAFIVKRVFKIFIFAKLKEEKKT